MFASADEREVIKLAIWKQKLWVTIFAEILWIFRKFSAAEPYAKLKGFEIAVDIETTNRRRHFSLPTLKSPTLKKTSPALKRAKAPDAASYWLAKRRVKGR